MTDPQESLSSRGVPITQVVSGSPADSAGLKVGDTLVSIDGRWTTSLEDTIDAAQSIVAGKTSTIVIVRDGVEVERELTPAEGI